MNVIAQSGFGKSTYIDEAIADGSIVGAILSPRDEDVNALRTTAQHLTEKNGVSFVAIDPQFYAFTIPDGRLRYLEKYPYNPGFLTRRRFSDTSALQDMSTRALDFQFGLSVTHLISPGIALVDLTDSYSQVYITMAQESIKFVQEHNANRPLLLSLILTESALLSTEAVDEFLDVITAWHHDGIYLCVQANNSTYPATLGPTALANLLYLIYVLAELNNYTVVVGYSDFNSMLFRAAGAKYLGTGWYNTLRQFSFARFEPKRAGGARPRPRYPSRPLLTSILIEPELAEIVDVGLEEYALSALSFDEILLKGGVNSSVWSASIAFRAHAAALSGVDDDFPLQGGAASQLDFALQMVQRSISATQLLARRGVSFETKFGFLGAWQQALEQMLDRI